MQEITNTSLLSRFNQETASTTGVGRLPMMEIVQGKFQSTTYLVVEHQRPAAATWWPGSTVRPAVEGDSSGRQPDLPDRLVPKSARRLWGGRKEKRGVAAALQSDDGIHRRWPLHLEAPRGAGHEGPLRRRWQPLAPKQLHAAVQCGPGSRCRQWRAPLSAGCCLVPELPAVSAPTHTPREGRSSVGIQDSDGFAESDPPGRQGGARGKRSCGGGRERVRVTEEPKRSSGGGRESTCRETQTNTIQHHLDCSTGGYSPL